VLTVVLILAGFQDWRKHEVTDWLTWPLFICGGIAAGVAVVNMDFLPLIISVFLIVAWYFDWMGGADVRMLSGLCGLWLLAGLLTLLATGIWGLILTLRKRGKEKIPALVGSAFAVVVLYLIEHIPR
jgi:Flp pilus assembly protein protease CpaA